MSHWTLHASALRSVLRDTENGLPTHTQMCDIRHHVNALAVAADHAAAMEVKGLGPVAHALDMRRVRLAFAAAFESGHEAGMDDASYATNSINRSSAECEQDAWANWVADKGREWGCKPEDAAT